MTPRPAAAATVPGDAVAADQATDAPASPRATAAEANRVRLRDTGMDHSPQCWMRGFALSLASRDAPDNRRAPCPDPSPRAPRRRCCARKPSPDPDAVIALRAGARPAFLE